MGQDKIMTPLESAEVAQLAMIETQRAIARSVDAAVDTMKGMQAEIRGVQQEIKQLVSNVGDIREKVIRIEAVGCDIDVAELRKDVEILKADKERRDGAFQFADTVRRWAPAFAALVFIAILFLRATGRLGIQQ